jgi:DNA repair exonuclease SbcCD ATPase subunit
MTTREIQDRIKNMDTNEKNAFLEKVVTAIGDMEDFLATGSSASTIVKEAKSTAGEILKNFQEELHRREEENLALRKENGTLKQQIGDVRSLKESIAVMSEQIEKMRHDCEQALRERDEAKEEVMKLQELWKKFTAGE